MTCEVPHLRLTDGHAWRNIVHETKQPYYSVIDVKNPPKDIDIKMSVADIAKKYKCGNQTVERWLVMLGVKKTKPEQTYDLYTAGMSLEEIAVKDKITVEAVRARLVRHCHTLGFEFSQREPKKWAGGKPLRPMPKDFEQYAVSESINSLMKRYKAKYDIIKRWLDEYKKMV